MSKVKSVKIQPNLPLVIPNNIYKFGLIWWSQTQVIEQKAKILQYHTFLKGHYSGTSKVKSAKIKLQLPLVVPSKISFQISLDIVETHSNY